MPCIARWIDRNNKNVENIHFRDVLELGVTISRAHLLVQSPYKAWAISNTLFLHSGAINTCVYRHLELLYREHPKSIPAA